MSPKMSKVFCYKNMQLQLNQTHELTELILNGLTTTQSNGTNRQNRIMTVRPTKAAHLGVTFGVKIAANGVKGDHKHIKDVGMVSETCFDFAGAHLTDKKGRPRLRLQQEKTL